MKHTDTIHMIQHIIFRKIKYYEMFERKLNVLLLLNLSK